MIFTSHRALWVALAAFVATQLAANAAPAQAQNAYQLTVTADHADALYKVGETVTFTIQLKRDQEPVEAELAWTLSKDGVPPVRTGKVKLTSGTAAVTGQLEEPGFLQCRITYRIPGSTNLTATGGAGIDPLQIKPSLPVPDDFDAYWAEQKKQLAAVPVNPRLTPVKSPATEVESFDLQADSVGAPVSGYFCKPKDAKVKSLPIILLVHGAGVRSSSLGSAAGWARQGFLALDINAHGLPNGKPDAFYTELTKNELKNYSTRGKESRDTIYFRGMFLRLIRALDFLTAQPEWDARTVVVHGSSQGGAQSIVAAGLDARVTFIAAGVPAMCDHTGVAANRVNGWPHFLPNPPGKPQPNELQAVRYYDAMNFATRTKAAAIFTVGFIDTTCPPTSVYAAYNALPGKKEIFNDPPSTHAVSSKAYSAMRNAILKHVAGQ